jgi:hypothetical protein
MKNQEAKLMKNIKPSDRSPMVLSAVNSTAAVNNAASLAMPVSTALIWGREAVAGANTAIWGTLGRGGATRKQDFSAIWGTSGISAPMQNAGKVTAITGYR